MHNILISITFENTFWIYGNILIFQLYFLEDFIKTEKIILKIRRKKRVMHTLGVADAGALSHMIDLSIIFHSTAFCQMQKKKTQNKSTSTLF